MDYDMSYMSLCMREARRERAAAKWHRVRILLCVLLAIATYAVQGV